MSFKFSAGLKLAKVPQIMGKTSNVKLRTVEVIEAQSLGIVSYLCFVSITEQELRGNAMPSWILFQNAMPSWILFQPLYLRDQIVT